MALITVAWLVKQVKVSLTCKNDVEMLNFGTLLKVLEKGLFLKRGDIIFNNKAYYCAWMFKGSLYPSHPKRVLWMQFFY